jgi:hypothetical protein
MAAAIGIDFVELIHQVLRMDSHGDRQENSKVSRHVKLAEQSAARPESNGQRHQKP